jgi:predicted CoA-binding protein
MADIPTIVEVMALAMFSNVTAARCVIERLEAAGFAVVPVEPTTKMRTVGGNSLWPRSIDFADEVWRAMVGARPR